MSIEDDALRDLIEKAKQSVSKNGHNTTNSKPEASEPPPVDSVPAINYGRWRLEAGYVIKRALDNVPEDQRPMIASMEAARLIELVVSQAREVIAEKKPPWYPLPPELSETDIDEELHGLASRAIEVFREVYLPTEQPVPAHSALIVSETSLQAEIANAEYLSRPAIVDGLAFARAISLTVGGKHEGKTTITRTKALAIAAGEPFFGRATMQSPVIYAASSDEYATTRMELLRMGWRSRDLPLTLLRIGNEEAEPKAIVSSIAELAIKLGARFVVLDMLFDFIRVQDENRYAQTRAAISLIQTLSDEIDGGVDATHHTPKWFPDAATAAKAALGSQGIAARFTPIILCRKWYEDLYTIESTMTRDPRGVPIKPTLVVRDENGWVKDGGVFKAWMKWKMYLDRILGLFEGQDDRSMTSTQVAEALEISKHEAANALLQMWKEKILDRRNGSRNQKLYSMPSENLFSSNP